MRKAILLFLAISFGLAAFAQKVEYSTALNVPYYNDQEHQSDSYVANQCVLDLYYPKNVKGFATVVWFHGGGLTSGEKEIPEALKGKGFAVVGVNYRLSPKVHSPKFIEDAAASVAWVFNHIQSFGGDPSLIFVSGHSAGGYLTLMVGLDKRWLDVYHIDANRIAGLIPLSGQTITHIAIRHERGIPDTQPVVDDLAPLNHVRADAPPLLLITGDRELEMLGRYEENAYLMRMMKVAGHKNTRLYELDGYGHSMTEPAFPLLVSEVKKIINEKRGTNK
ncbi:MAG: alpha/beta hydrolase [Bacteroidota bacterium]|nr:alpha/beta hydrolase [Bacteroidota bacterium]MDP4275308.1 alpha/beta hydrolase [Bacteroidota bacterium]